MRMYKVYYRTGNGSESYTFIEADSEEMIKSVLYHVQGMTAELIRYEEVENELLRKSDNNLKNYAADHKEMGYFLMQAEFGEFGHEWDELISESF